MTSKAGIFLSLGISSGLLGFNIAQAQVQGHKPICRAGLLGQFKNYQGAEGFEIQFADQKEPLPIRSLIFERGELLYVDIENHIGPLPLNSKFVLRVGHGRIGVFCKGDPDDLTRLNYKMANGPTPVQGSANERLVLSNNRNSPTQRQMTIENLAKEMTFTTESIFDSVVKPERALIVAKTGKTTCKVHPFTWKGNAC